MEHMAYQVPYFRQRPEHMISDPFHGTGENALQPVQHPAQPPPELVPDAGHVSLDVIEPCRRVMPQLGEQIAVDADRENETAPRPVPETIPDACHVMPDVIEPCSDVVPQLAEQPVDELGRGSRPGADPLPGGIPDTRDVMLDPAEPCGHVMSQCADCRTGALDGCLDDSDETFPVLT